MRRLAAFLLLAAFAASGCANLPQAAPHSEPEPVRDMTPYQQFNPGHRAP